MKIPTVLLVATIASTLSLVPAMRAAPPVSAKKRAQIAALMQDREASRYTFHEMMKDREKKQYMAQVMAHDAEAREFYGAEVGNGAPHQERNPSQHPELFQTRKP